MQMMVRELLALWRELGATWGEVAETIRLAESCNLRFTSAAFPFSGRGDR
ncbi:unnamed protein product [Symbiodinium pilosum]|uniref:Uncharacterized protein n=1 Tax=Symbiodinium pilosum TaxID=2952 RepID=A0A812QYY0_SYMPI|nr:unnamed protein product [Symbiodinium pilosum]